MTLLRRIFRVLSCSLWLLLPVRPLGWPARSLTVRGALVGLLTLAGGWEGGFGARLVLAQTPAVGAPGNRTSRGDTALVDTTIRRGRQDFTGYTTPGRCLAAARAVETLAHRGAADSTGYHYDPADTLSGAAVALARRCGARFTVANTAAADQLDLAQVALMAGDDATARVAADRYMAAITEPEAYRWALYAADTLYIHAKPRRWALVDAMTARLDSLGPPAALQRKIVHFELYLDARQRYDVARLRREVLALFAACPHLSARDVRAEGACEENELGLTLVQVELYQSPGEVQAALARAGRLVAPLGFKDWEGFRRGLLTAEFTRVPLEQLGKVVPPLVAQHWVGPAGRAPGWPVKGKVSIFLRGSVESDRPEKMALWKRLGEKYKDVLDITILLATKGSFRSGPPLSPAEEAQRLGRYYREQLGLPVTVAVQETPVTQLPPPDGRLIRGEPPLAKDPYYSGGFILTDPTGKILLARWMGSGNEPMLDAWIARAAGR